MEKKKYSGVLLSITSLPGKYGIGQLGKSAYNFIDFLAEANFRYWEILPLCPTNITNSPYQGTSSSGCNIYMIDFDLLVEEGLLNSRDFQGVNFGNNTRRIDYKKVFENSRLLLYKAYKRFDKDNEGFKRFINQKSFHDFAIYMSLKEINDYKAWYDWNLEDRYFEKEVEEDLMKNHSDIYYFYLFTQYIFVKQWMKLKAYAASKGILIVGQIAHFIGYDSDDVYLHPEEFLLDKLGRMTLVAGFPPDNFTKDGQKWGEPLYDWSYMKSTHYKWWRNRLNRAFFFYDSVMINHFSGFYKVYGIPFRAKNAKKGEFLYTSGFEIIDEFKDQKVVASDLGNTDEDVTTYIEKTGFTTLFAAGDGLFRSKLNYEQSLPSNIPENAILYIGNHDNATLKNEIERLSSTNRETLIGRIVSELDKLGLDKNFNIDSNRELFNKIVQLVGHSKARCVTYTMQDILYQDEDSRMNYPGSIDTKLNWTYRFLQSDINKNVIGKWKNINIESHRD